MQEFATTYFSFLNKKIALILQPKINYLFTSCNLNNKKQVNAELRIDGDFYPCAF